MKGEPTPLAWVGYALCVQFLLVCTFVFAFARQGPGSPGFPFGGFTGQIAGATFVASAIAFVLGLVVLVVTRERRDSGPEQTPTSSPGFEEHRGGD